MNPIIEVKDLSFSYHDGTKALKGVSFSISEGECVGLIGPNGAGKSTLILHLNGLLPEAKHNHVSVKIAGEEISKKNENKVHSLVGVLFQNPDDQLFCPTVYEDVAFGPRQLGVNEEDIRSMICKTLEDVGIPGFENRSPHHLSGGEKQRVCLAGLLVCDPKILVLDEPTRDLDPRGRRELSELLHKIPMTKIIASHDLELIVKLCKRTIILDSGKIVADGNTIELLSNEKLMIEHGLEKPHSLQHIHPHN
ncbi:MAG: energy-coupling factor ABC transporter ATP-binding protein [Ignavibacteriales bacterium]|nr:energy-coupling factor ABC transporter ATP-binding protein [Ignavibacteriales bacterium]